MRVGIYEIIDLLGDGGMGSVYRARDPRFDRLVALKVLHPHYQRNQEIVGRFKTEAVVQAKLDHPHIVSVYDFLTGDDGLAIVMELVEGLSAEGLLDREGPLPVDRGLALFEQVLAAIGYAHDKGLVHRDVKPSNILTRTVDRREIAKVVDFGIAKIVGSERQKTGTTAKLGTLAYMSPEQVRSPRGVDSRSDVYSLGATLQQLLTGRLPFEGATEFEVMRAILEGEAAPPSTADHPLPKPVERAIRKSLLRDADQRFQTCAEFLDALRGAPVEIPSGRAPISVAPTEGEPGEGSASRSETRDGRRSAGWLAAVVATLLISGGGFGGWQLYEGVRQQEREVASEKVEAERQAAAAIEYAERLRRDREEQERRERERALHAQLEKEAERQRAEEEAERRRQRQKAYSARLDEVRQALEDAARVARLAMEQGDLDGARRALEEGRSRTPADLRADLDAALAEVGDLLVEVDKREVRRLAAAEAEQKLREARRRHLEEELERAKDRLVEGKFPEARGIGLRLAESEDAPEDIRKAAAQVVADAEAGLQGVWGGATLGEAEQQKKKDNRP